VNYVCTFSIFINGLSEQDPYFLGRNITRGGGNIHKGEERKRENLKEKQDKEDKDKIEVIRGKWKLNGGEVCRSGVEQISKDRWRKKKFFGSWGGGV
jgi:hypothetical protein